MIKWLLPPVLDLRGFVFTPNGVIITNPVKLGDGRLGVLVQGREQLCGVTLDELVENEEDCSSFVDTLQPIHYTDESCTKIIGNRYEKERD